jgi:hypothetical protein
MPKSECLIVLGFVAALALAAGWASGQAGGDLAEQLLDAARGGDVGTVQALLERGADPNAKGPGGRTPLHEAAAGGHQQTAQILIDAGADINARDDAGKTPLDLAQAAGHSGMAAFLRERVQAPPEDGPTGLKPSLEFGTLEAFEREIGEPAVILDSRHVCFFAPMRRAQEAAVVLPHLAAAYEELYAIVGRHTEYRIAVYAFPRGNPHGWGGTSNCSIEYDEANLDLNAQQEWVQYHVPHVSGYIEEMAHNFVHATGAQFGWEMVGWSIGAEVSLQVAGNPILRNQIASTRERQRETFERYVRNGLVLPADVPANQCDRIHAWILRQCEEAYGKGFWKDFFREVRGQAQRLQEAALIADADANRNARYRITVECFDRLPGLAFKDRLRQAGISLTTDVKALHPESTDWNRRLQE